MRTRHVGLAAAVLLLVGLTAARADNLAAFNAAVEDIAAHNRAALGFLASDDPDLAAAELRKMQASWGTFAQNFGRDRPDAFRDNALYVTMLVDVPTRIVTAMIMINFGRPAIAKNSLQAIREEFSAVRRASGVEVLADAVLDANTKMNALRAWRTAPPDWERRAAEVAPIADAYAAAISRCAALAAEPLRSSRELRRIVEGVAAALAELPPAIAARDDARLRRVIDELHELDSILAARYG